MTARIQMVLDENRACRLLGVFLLLNHLQVMVNVLGLNLVVDPWTVSLVWRILITYLEAIFLGF